MSSSILAEVTDIDPELAKELRIALGNDPIEHSMSGRKSLTSLRETLKVRVRALYLQFLQEGMKSLGQDPNELDEGSGVEKSKAVQRLSGEISKALGELGLPADPSFWK